MSMDEKNQPASPVADFDVIEPKDGVTEIYSNLSHLSWTGMDVSVQLYQFVQPNRDLPKEAHKPNQLLHKATVTFTWSSAKMFYKMLGDVLERYEKAHGQIPTEFKAV